MTGPAPTARRRPCSASAPPLRLPAASSDLPFMSMPPEGSGATIWRGSAQGAGSVAGNDWLACLVWWWGAQPRYSRPRGAARPKRPLNHRLLASGPGALVVGVARLAMLGPAGRGLAEERYGPGQWARSSTQATTLPPS